MLGASLLFEQAHQNVCIVHASTRTRQSPRKIVASNHECLLWVLRQSEAWAASIRKVRFIHFLSESGALISIHCRALNWILSSRVFSVETTAISSDEQTETRCEQYQCLTRRRKVVFPPICSDWRRLAQLLELVNFVWTFRSDKEKVYWKNEYWWIRPSLG